MYAAQPNALTYAVNRARWIALGDGPQVVTPDFIAQTMAGLGPEWTDKERAWFQAQLGYQVGSSFTVKDGSWWFPDGTGLTPIAAFNNFSLSTGDAQTDIDNAFLDTYGNQLNVDYGSWVKVGNMWHNPYDPNGPYLADNMYQAEVAIQQLLQQAYASKNYDSLQDQIQAVLAGAEAAAVPLAPVVTAPSTYLIDGVEVYADGTPVVGGYNAADDAAAQIAAQGGGVNPVTGAYVPPAPGSVPSGGTIALDPTVVTDPTMPNGSPVAVVPAPGAGGVVTAPGGPITDPSLGPIAVNPDGSSVIGAGGFISTALQNPIVLVGLAGAAYVLLRKRR